MFVAEDAVHGSVVGYDDVIVHVDLKRGQAELYKSNLCIVDLRRPAGRFGTPLSKHQTVHQFGIVGGPERSLCCSTVKLANFDAVLGFPVSLCILPN